MATAAQETKEVGAENGLAMGLDEEGRERPWSPGWGELFAEHKQPTGQQGTDGETSHKELVDALFLRGDKWQPGEGSVRAGGGGNHSGRLCEALGGRMGVEERKWGPGEKGVGSESVTEAGGVGPWGLCGGGARGGHRGSGVGPRGQCGSGAGGCGVTEAGSGAWKGMWSLKMVAILAYEKLR